MINYTWNIMQLDCSPLENGLTNVIKAIHWMYTAQEVDGDQLISSCSSYYTLPFPEPEQFVDFETLTEEQVIGWLESTINVSMLRNTLANEIATQHNPPIRSLPLPWNVIEEVVQPIE